LFDLPAGFRANPVPNAKSASSEEEDESLNEKILLRFLSRRLLRFSEEAVKKEAMPPPMDFRAGWEISKKEEESEVDDFLPFAFLGDRLRLRLRLRLR
jgi:hypothetical protein